MRDKSSKSGKSQPKTQASNSLGTACALLSGSGVLLATPPGQAAVIYSGAQNISVSVPAPTGGINPTDGVNFSSVDLGFGGNGTTRIGWYSTAPGNRSAAKSTTDVYALYVDSGSNSSIEFLNSFSNVPIGNNNIPVKSLPLNGGEAVPVGNTPSCSGTACTWLSGSFPNTSKYDNSNVLVSSVGEPLPSTFFAGYRFTDPTNPSDYYYGWLRLQLPASSLPGNNALTLVDWAYESVANQQILAGAGAPTPGPLPALGAAAALTASRRLRRRIAAAKATEAKG